MYNNNFYNNAFISSWIVSLRISSHFADFEQVKKISSYFAVFEQVKKISSHFAVFEQVKKISSHFADFEQVKKISSHFADFEQVKKISSHFADLGSWIFWLLSHTYFLYYIKKRVKHFYNNFGIHRVIIYFTVCLCILKIKKVIFWCRFVACSFLVYYSIRDHMN